MRRGSRLDPLGNPGTSDLRAAGAAIEKDPEKPVLLVASAGGHLEELLRIRRRLTGPAGSVEWVTPTSAQALSLLAGEVVHTVPYVGPRDLRVVSGQFFKALTLLGSRRYSAVLSTGAAIAVPYLAAARLLNIPTHYIESAARSLAPSLTGKIIEFLPGVQLYTQYETWTKSRWKFQGSVFDGFEALPKPRTSTCRNVVVTLGTMQNYGFRRAVEAVLRVLDELPEYPESILWQTGCTDLAGLDVPGRVTVPSAELSEAMAGADVVIAHAGVGSALSALAMGKCPVLLPRSAACAEHVDDHQAMVAQHLATRGLAIVRDPSELVVEDLYRAMENVAVEARHGAAFQLG